MVEIYKHIYLIESIYVSHCLIEKRVEQSEPFIFLQKQNKNQGFNLKKRL